MSLLENPRTLVWRLPRIPRQVWVVLHRYVGLAIMIFVFNVGITGALLSFNDELDRFFLGDLGRVTPTGAMIAEPVLLAIVSAAYPDATAEIEGPAADHPTQAAQFWLEPKGEAALPRDEVFVNPYTGQILGDRKWGEIHLDGRHFMPMVYRLHYALLVQDWDGWGFWVMGIVSLLWAFDHVASLILSIPRNGPFWKAMTVKWRGSAYRINFDIHRAFGLGMWVIMAMLALTGASWNATFFGTNVVQYAIDATTSTTTAAMDRVADRATPLDAPALDMVAARAAITGTLAAMAYEPQELYVEYNAAKGAYQVWARLDAGGTQWLQAALDGNSGQVLALNDPKDRKIGDIIKDWIYPLHSGQAFGLVGRILICLTGIATAVFCVTGFVIWLKKARARAAARKKALVPRKRLVAAE